MASIEEVKAHIDACVIEIREQQGMVKGLQERIAEQIGGVTQTGEKNEGIAQSVAQVMAWGGGLTQSGEVAVGILTGEGDMGIKGKLDECRNWLTWIAGDDTGGLSMVLQWYNGVIETLESYSAALGG